MMRLAEIPERASQRAQGVAQHARPAGAARVQPSGFSVAAYAFGHAENIRNRNPVAPLHGGIADRANPICSFLVKYASVYCYSSINNIQYNASKGNCAFGKRSDENALSVADGRIHAGPSGTEGDRRVLEKQGGDDFLGCGHDGNGSQAEVRYSKP